MGATWATSATLLVLLGLPAIVSAVAGDEHAGYVFGSDVEQHLKLDLDQKEMEETTDAAKWSEANLIYSAGKNSEKTDSKRTLQGFSTDAGGKMGGEPFFELYQRYYNRPDYSDRVVTDALDGAAEFSGKPDIFRAEVANKGSQYSGVWMYIIHELEDAINDCEGGDLTDNDAKVKAWDEGWAFYTGSLVADGGDGVMPFTLAKKRCADFGTCSADGTAPVNDEIRSHFTAGKADLEAGRCGDALAKKNDIARLMAVPVIQGLLRYVIQAKPEGDSQPKAHAEGLAFARGVLPWIDHCDSGSAKKIVENFQARADPPMKDSIDDVAKDIYKVLGCMGISCDMIGSKSELPQCETSGDVETIPGEGSSAVANNKENLFDGEVSGKDPVTDGFGSEPEENDGSDSGSSGSSSGSSGSSGSTNNKSSGGLSTGAKVGIGLGAVAALAVLAFLSFRFLGNKKKFNNTFNDPITPVEV